MKQVRKIYDKAFKEKAVQLSYDRTNILEFARELGITAPQLYKWRKEFEEFGEGSFPGKGNLKQTPEQEKIHELEKRLKDAELERDILKKSNRHFFQERSMIYSFIKNNEQLFPIEKMCKVLQLSSGSYYRWKKQIITARQQLKIAIKEQITLIYFESKQRYGSPRITLELRSFGYKISRITVAKYMKQLGLRSKLSKKFKVTTNSNHNYLIVENILKREFIVKTPSKAWVSDITYIQTKEGFVYLTTIMDLYDRKIIGWSLSDGMSTEETTLGAWKMAVKNRNIEQGLIFHSDRGVQYASKKFVNVLDSYKKITRSMSRKGNCWDNAVAESFFKSLKTELIYGNKLISKEQMKLEIFEYIEVWYNRKRRLLLMPLLIFSFFVSRPVAGEEATLGLTPEQIEEIESKLAPVFKGKPVSEIAEADRPLLFLAEGLFPESYDLFFRHGEYLATEKRSFTEAIPRLKKALDLKPKDLPSLELLAQCHTELKQASEEVACWETLRELIEEDDTEETRDLRERITVNLGRMAEENEMTMRQGRRFIIYTPINSEYIHIQNELSDERLEEIYLQITGDLDCIPAFRTSIIVLDPIKFDAVKPASWAGGFAQGGKSMTLKTESFPSSDSAVRLPARGILLHEFTHNIVFISGAGRCPTWLNEGLAVFAEHKDDTFTEFKPQLPAPEQLMTLDQLELEFAAIRNLDGGPRVDQAYQLAGLYARFIIQNFTMTAPRLILNSLKNNRTFASALLDVCSLPIPQFEKRFRNWATEMTNH